MARRKSRPGPAPTPRRVLKARGSWRAQERPEESKPPRRIGRKPRELTAEEILGGIPGYDPRLQAEGFVYDHERALKAIRFFHDRLTLVTGMKPGTRFGLQPWQQAVTGNMFGWIDPKTGRRRYRFVFVFVPKKNAKTEWSAGIVLKVLRDEAANGIRCVSLAAGKDQTNNVFEPAAQMIANDRELRAHFVVYGNSAGATNKSIVSPLNPLSTFRGLPHDANTSDGKGPWLIVADELHRWMNGELLDIMLKGQISVAVRGEPLALLTTTADYNRESICNQWLKRARLCRDNPGAKDEVGWDPRLLPVIYEASPKDDWRDPETHRKANPSYGVTVSPEFLSDEVRAVEAEPSKLNAFLRFHLNVVTDQAEAAIPLDAWRACPVGVPSDEELAGIPSWGGADYARSIDLNAFALHWPSVRVLKLWFWRPRDTTQAAEHRDRVPYFEWARAGWLTLVPGAGIEAAYMLEQLDGICKVFRPVDIGYDRALIGREVAVGMTKRGWTMVEMAQGHFTLAPACRDFERLVVSSEIRHEGNPVMAWNVGCLTWRYDENGGICYSKKESQGCIDGVAAAVMAIARASVAPQRTESPYKKGGLFILT